MANDYIDIKMHTDDNSKIALSKGVFESIAREAIKEELKAVLAEQSAFQKAVTCKIVNNQLNINVDIKVKTGVNVNQICEHLQERIFQNIYQMTDIKCYFIDIRVIGFVF